MNPLLDAVHVWQGLEWAIERLMGVSPRPSPDATEEKIVRRKLAYTDGDVRSELTLYHKKVA